MTGTPSVTAPELVRGSLVAYLRTQAAWGPSYCERIADQILALVRPAEGITLTPEEASLALDWYHGAEMPTPMDNRDRALAARLRTVAEP